MLAVSFSIVTIVDWALKSIISHVPWSFRSLHLEQTCPIIAPPAAPLSFRKNFKDCSGARYSQCTEGVFGSLRNLIEEPGRKEMWSLILVSIRANRTPSAWDDGLVTCISLNLQGHSSDEIAVAHNGGKHRRGMVVGCIVFEGSGATVGIPSVDE